MKGDKGPALVIGIGKAKKADEGSDEEEAAESPEEESGEDDTFAMHADELFDALKSGDRAGFADALKKCLMAGESGAYEE